MSRRIPDASSRRMRGLLFALLVACGSLSAQGVRAQGNSLAPGSREAMWPAPTKEDWAKPCLIHWERTFEDAVAVAQETGKPILISVNMDGEIASEHYAGIRYRRPETAALYEPYVNVIASVYRHTPRDFDDEGHRILCPRFGSVTCGEHIAIEPGLFDGFFEGQRVAPRHVMVELADNGGFEETYDVYYAFDTASVFDQIKQGIANRPPTPTPAYVERTDLERVASPANADRTAVERAYRTGSRAERRTLLRAAVAQKQVFQSGLLRMALFDLDLELNKIARIALSEADTPQAIDLIVEALRVPMEDEERESLVAALERIGESSQRARTLAVVHRGLAGESQEVDVERWTKAVAANEAGEVHDGLPEMDPRLEYEVQASSAHPEDPRVKLALAEAYLSYAVDPDTADLLAPTPGEAMKYARLFYEDARRTALAAEELGDSSWRMHAVVALASYYLGDRRAGYERSQLAVDAMPPGAEGWTAMATMALFAEARQRAIWLAERDGRAWPPSWLTDVNAAYSVLAGSPYGTAAQAVAHYDFLRRLGAVAQAAHVLDVGIERFSASWELHDRLRGRVFEDRGLEGLEAAYEERLAGLGATPELRWYAGYASLVAAEFHRRAGESEAAQASYGRAIAHFERAAGDAPGMRDSADHYIALALAGRARMALEQGDLATALDQLLASLERRAEAAASLDGLGLTPVMTAQMLLARLKEEGDAERAERLQEALDELDPELLIAPAFENLGPTRGRAGRRSGPRGSGR